MHNVLANISDMCKLTNIHGSFHKRVAAGFWANNRCALHSITGPWFDSTKMSKYEQ